MAFENLYIKTKKSIGGVVLDAVVSESHESVVTITQNPVEAGFKTTDHAVIEPKVITLQVSVSDSPLGFASVRAIVDLVTGLFGSSDATNATRSQAAYNSLRLLQESRTLLDIETKIRDYKSMLITSISLEQDAESSRTADMTIVLRELLVMTTQEVTVELTDTTAEQADPEVNRGRQEPTIPGEQKQKSILKTTLDWING